MNQSLIQVDPQAKIAPDVVIEPFSVIAKNVQIDQGSHIGPNVTIMEGARIGKNVRIYPGAVISAPPQDLKYRGEHTFTYIGDDTVIRECVTINRGTRALGYTRVGKSCLIMASSHVAHDCVLGDNVILVNGVALAGHIEIGAWAIIGGMSAIHQFTKIGEHSLIAGGTLVRKDVPPFVKAGRMPISYVGVNSTGLQRRGFTKQSIEEIRDIYRTLYQKKLNVSQALEAIKEKFPNNYGYKEILGFIQNSERGIMRGHSKKDLTTEI